MPTLPRPSDLGPLPTAAPTRPVASYDVSGLARGAQALAQGTQALGQGIEKAGEGIGSYAIDRNRWDYAIAHAQGTAGLVEQHASLAADTDYKPDDQQRTMADRYEAAARDRVNQAAARIEDPRMRERFTEVMAPQIEQMRKAAELRQRSLDNNANVAYVQQQGDDFINKAVAAPDDDSQRKLIDAHNGLVDGLQAKGAITPEQGVAMKKNWASQYATADYLAAINSNDPARIQAAVARLQGTPGSGDAITGRILQNEGTSKNPTSSATGAGQFIDSTWLDMIKRHRPDLAQGRSDGEILALRADRNLGREMTEAYRGENETYLKSHGLPATPGQQYLAHFLGPGTATAVLKADPNAPVIDVLTQAVGADKAAKIVAANRSVLDGQLAGSVTQWADRKMGGGDVYELLHLNPVVREQLLARGQAAMHKQVTGDIAAFHNSVQDDLAEADRNGLVAKPKALPDFVAHYGADHGPAQFAQYQQDLQASADKRMLVSMPLPQMGELVQQFAPQAGTPGYAAGTKRQAKLADAANKLLKERADDPAQYGVDHLPAVQESWKALTDTLNDATATPQVRNAMARDYATKQVMEQQRLGVDRDAVRIVPQGYVDNLAHQLTSAANDDDAQKRVALVGQIQREAAMWGQYWPQVMREIAPKSQPLVRAIAAGADTGAMTRLLSLDPKMTAQKIIGEQNETKYKDTVGAVNTALAPFRATMVGRQLDRDFPGYEGLAITLAALHVRDGDSAERAADKAYNELIGNRYEMRDTWRMPKSAGIDADDVQAGTAAVRSMLEQAAAQPGDAQGFYERNRPFVKAGATDFATKLPADDEKQFRNWVASNKVPFDPDAKGPQDYDMRGFWQALRAGDARAKSAIDPNDQRLHFPDYWKTPYHETFSNESQFANGQAPHWTDDDKLVTPAGQVLFDDRHRAPHDVLGMQPFKNDIGVEDSRADSYRQFSRGGRFVTAPSNDGLNLVYDTARAGPLVVRDAQRRPVLITWAQLGALGHPLRAANEAAADIRMGP